MRDWTTPAASRLLAQARARYIQACQDTDTRIDLDLLDRIGDLHTRGIEPDDDMRAWIAEWVGVR